MSRAVLPFTPRGWRTVSTVKDLAARGWFVVPVPSMRVSEVLALLEPESGGAK